MTNEEVKYIQGDDTAEFLNKISRRLSSRDDCKGVEFEVKISKEELSMKPLIYVFPDTHHRADIDKMSILNFIIHSSNRREQRLTEGTYKYQYANPITRRKRRWVKVG